MLHHGLLLNFGVFSCSSIISFIACCIFAKWCDVVLCSVFSSVFSRVVIFSSICVLFFWYALSDSVFCVCCFFFAIAVCKIVYVGM